jgi:MEMO1 family protein
MNRLFRMMYLSGVFLCALVLSESACHTQTQKNENMAPTNQELKTRKAVVAGQFYPGNAGELRKELGSFFVKPTAAVIPGHLLAVIAPHAGYVFSGAVAAESFMQIDRDKSYDNIFIIGSSHHVSFDGASIYTLGNFETPLGVVPVNTQLATELVNAFSCFTSRTDAHLQEHCLEVQLPFLQYWLQKPFRIIPIILGTQSVPTCRKIADALRPYMNDSNLFVVSTDFSHYPDYEDARATDRKTADAILTNKPDRLLKVLEMNEEAGVTGLATSLCGWTSVVTLLYMTHELPGIGYHLIDYKNSGDAVQYGDKSRVVGYCSIAVTQKADEESNPRNQETFRISAEDQTTLLRIAHETIDEYIRHGKVPKIRIEDISPVLLTQAGAFVSLYKKGHLRGCIGRFNPNEPLYKVVQDMAVSSATQDYRFSPVEAEEIPELKIEISVLTPLKRITSKDEIVLGKSGIYIKKGSSSGTFLPQVASSTGWTIDEFLGHCSQDKAGIGWDGWKTAELYTYEAIIMSDK